MQTALGLYVDIDAETGRRWGAGMGGYFSELLIAQCFAHAAGGRGGRAQSMYKSFCIVRRGDLDRNRDELWNCWFRSRLQGATRRTSLAGQTRRVRARPGRASGAGRTRSDRLRRPHSREAALLNEAWNAGSDAERSACGRSLEARGLHNQEIAGLLDCTLRTVAQAGADQAYWATPTTDEENVLL